MTSFLLANQLCHPSSFSLRWSTCTGLSKCEAESVKDLADTCKKHEGLACTFSGCRLVQAPCTGDESMTRELEDLYCRYQGMARRP
mmetsp:Transcript_11332/g.41470  ORF Transcript_11332/g.41470 Transcript_11332/m.41470 type:complete len:86 (+) Transcript_11332:1385-1642(+)